MLAEQDSPIHLLFRGVSNLERSSAFDSFEPQVLSQVEQEARLISSVSKQLLTSGPAVRRITSDNLVIVFVGSNRCNVWLIWHLHQNYVGLPELFIFLFFKHIKHFIELVACLARVIFQVYLKLLDRFDLLPDNFVKRKIEVQQAPLHFFEYKRVDKIRLPDVQATDAFLLVAHHVLEVLVVHGKHSENWPLDRSLHYGSCSSLLFLNCEGLDLLFNRQEHFLYLLLLLLRLFNRCTNSRELSLRDDIGFIKGRRKLEVLQVGVLLDLRYFRNVFKFWVILVKETLSKFGGYLLRSWSRLNFINCQLLLVLIVLQWKRLDILVTLNLKILVNDDLNLYLAEGCGLLANLQFKQIVACGKLEKLKRVRTFHLVLEVVTHELDFLVLSCQLQTVGLQDACLVLDRVVKVFEGTFDYVGDLLLCLCGLVFDGRDLIWDLVHLVFNHCLSLLKGWVLLLIGPVFCSWVCVLQRY